MEAFENLPPQKRQTIEDAALAAFGGTGYAKTSMRDVAAAAGISKAMVFHYFGTKRQLYDYLLGLCARTMTAEFESRFDRGVTDFFDRMRMATGIKLAALQAHPALLRFLMRAYFETDPAVRPDTQEAFLFGEAERFRSELVMKDVDVFKFKPGVDPAQVLELLVYYAYGLTDMEPAGVVGDLGAVCRRFDAMLEMLRRNLYRPECL